MPTENIKDIIIGTDKYNTEIEAGQKIEIGEELINSEEENNAFLGADETDKTRYRKSRK